ncbi:MAG: aspartate ammonia-lyase [Planctomycetes bacterium]|nr:aspartate ammonia-lyase [Planctomycetota bacterium]
MPRKTSKTSSTTPGRNPSSKSAAQSARTGKRAAKTKAQPAAEVEATPEEAESEPIVPVETHGGLFREETDSLGTVRVPFNVYYGAQTQRAVENFTVSGRLPHRGLVRAYVAVKKACAMANQSLGKLDDRRGEVICRACDEVLGRDELIDQWVVDVFQAGAGTSMNMNTNEVLANRALELMGKQRGQYALLSPNDHVNMSQSTNDTFPTAMHVAALLVWKDLAKALNHLARVLRTKARLFDSVLKSARTHLQDAVPIRLGQEFAAYGEAVQEAHERIDRATHGLLTVALGGSAAGTGLNTHEQYASTAVGNLGRIVNLPLAAAKNLPLRMQSMAPVAAVSGALRNLALELIRIANDLRLLASGPRTGLAEINLPAVQPGSSIMPGKVNPSLAECLNMICFQVIGNDTAIAMAVQAGQLELNVMMPGMAVALLDSMEYLKNFLPVFAHKCVEGITVNEDRCRGYFEASVGLATILNQKIGYLKAAEVAKQSVASGKSILEICRQERLLSAEEFRALGQPKASTEPSASLLGRQKKP